jgi:hypothetical protein
MAEAVSGAAGKAAMRPHPSITTVTFWQGIVEIVLRVIGVVVSFICIITAVVALDKLEYRHFNTLDRQTGDDWSDTAKLSDAASGFLIFVAVVTIVLEGLIIAQRFLNFGIVDKFTLIFHFVDIGISAVVAFLLFCVAVSTAVYAGRFADYESKVNDASDVLDDAADLNEVMASVSFFSFVGLFLFAGLASFMGVCVMLKWRNTQAKYAEKA